MITLSAFACEPERCGRALGSLRGWENAWHRSECALEIIFLPSPSLRLFTRDPVADFRHSPRRKWRREGAELFVTTCILHICVMVQHNPVALRDV
mgnify:CR=1 FL=1